MNVTVIGHKGMLGHDLIARLELAGFRTGGLDIDEVDISRHRDLHARLSELCPDIVINCAAYTAVDQAESEPEKVFAVNRDGPANLADICKNIGSVLVHLSTDYVFDGNAKRPYSEEAPVNPIGIYAESKEAGERAVRTRLEEHLIVRTAWLYGVHGNNFVKTMIRLFRERETLEVVSDQIGCPTWALDLAEALVLMIAKVQADRENISWGTYHYCGGGNTSWYGFAREILEQARKYEALKTRRILPIPTTAFPTPAKRPSYSVLRCSKIEDTFGIHPRNWQAALVMMLEAYYGTGPA